MISSVCWVPRGAAKKTPEVAELTEEELAAMKAAAGDDGDDGRVVNIIFATCIHNKLTFKILDSHLFTSH